MARFWALVRCWKKAWACWVRSVMVGGCGVRDLAFHRGPDPFDGVVLRAVFRALDDLDSGDVAIP